MTRFLFSPLNLQSTPEMAVILLDISRLFATKVPGKIDSDVLQLLWKVRFNSLLHSLTYCFGLGNDKDIDLGLVHSLYKLTFLNEQSSIDPYTIQFIGFVANL